MMYYRISKNEKNLFFGKKIAQVWAVTLSVMILSLRNHTIFFSVENKESKYDWENYQIHKKNDTLAKSKEGILMLIFKKDYKYYLEMYCSAIN